jgi:hypothetical protein
MRVILQLGRAANAPGVVPRAFRGEQPTGGDDPPGDDDRSTLTARPRQLESNDLDRVDPSDARVSRLSEIIGALPRWDRATLDHRTLWAAPEGLAPIGSAVPYVSVDGIPAPIDVFGSLALDRLPLSPGELESVEAASTPGLHGLGFRRAGALELKTALPRSEGLGGFFEVVAENPTDDPGPFSYTDSTAQNVDKLGTGYVVGLTGKRGRVSGAAGFKYLSDFMTDAGLGGRPISLRDPEVHYPVVRTYAPWATVRFRGGSASHVLRLGYSLRSDYHFLPALGFEVPTEMRFWQVGAAGEAQLAGLRWRYLAHSAWDHLRDVSNDLALGFDLRGVRRGLALAVEKGEASRLTVGGGIDEEQRSSRLLPTSIRLATARAYAKASARSRLGYLSLQGELRSQRSELAGDVALEAVARVPLLGSLQLTTWHSVGRAGVALGFWELREMGYSFLDSASVSVEDRGAETRQREVGTHLELTLGGAQAAFSVSPFLRIVRVHGARAAEPSFVQDGRRPSHEGPVLLFRSTTGSTLMGGAQVLWLTRRGVRIEARYRWLGPVGGDAPFRSASRSAPQHRYWQQVGWQVRSDLRLAWGIEARSATWWSSYAGMGRDRLAGSLVTDLSLDKTLWEGRARLCARVSDVGNRARPLHPLGASPGLAFAVCAGLKTR